MPCAPTSMRKVARTCVCGMRVWIAEHALVFSFLSFLNPLSTLVRQRQCDNSGVAAWRQATAAWQSRPEV